MKRGLKVWFLFVGLIFVFLNINFVSAWADNGSLNQNVNGCNLLNTTNATYTLTQSITSTATCLNVTAENITLDCQNNLINYSIGGTANTYGITTNQFNTTVNNCNILDGNWTSVITSRHGIYFNTNDNSTLFNNSINVNNSYAIYLYSGSNFNNLTLNTGISNTTHAIYLSDSNFNNLTLNTGISNLRHGISLNLASNNNLISNTGKGLGCSTCNTDGIFLYLSSNNNLINNIGTSNQDGIILYSSSNNTLTNNTGTSNISVGLYLYMSANNTLTNNTGTSNTSGISYGILLYFSSNNTLTNNTGTSKASRGIAFDSSSNNTLIKATALSLNTTEASRSAIYIRESNYTNISDCINISGIAGDVYIHSDAGSVGNIFLNCSYNSSKESVNGVANELIRKWHYQAYVNDTSGAAIEGANISAYNVSDVLQFTNLTNSSGFIQRQEITEYVNTGGTKSYYSNYILNVAKAGYTMGTKSYNFTIQQNKLYDYFTLEEATGATPPPNLGGGGYPTFRPKEEELNKGYQNVMYKNWRVSFKVENISYTFKVENITETSVKISISSETQEATLLIGQEKKFELSGDNYYDVLVKLNSIDARPFYSLKANFTIQTIHEEISAENQAGSTENVNENIAKDKFKIIYYILGFVVLVLIISVIFRRVKRKK